MKWELYDEYTVQNDKAQEFIRRYKRLKTK